MSPETFFIVTSLLKIVAILFVVILPMVSYAVYAERKVSAAIQDRLGPNRVGPGGLLQPIADMFKLLLKEDFTPRAANTFYYWLAPCLAVMPAIITIAVVPFGSTLFGVPMIIADVNVGILFVFAIASLGVYGIVIGGWASNSKYPFLGGIRSSAQMLSYELSLGLAVIPVFLLVGNLRLTSVVHYQIEHGWFIAPFIGDWTNAWKWLLTIPMIISFLVFTIAIFAESLFSFSCGCDGRCPDFAMINLCASAGSSFSRSRLLTFLSSRRFCLSCHPSLPLPLNLNLTLISSCHSITRSSPFINAH